MPTVKTPVISEESSMKTPNKSEESSPNKSLESSFTSSESNEIQI